MSNNIEIKGGDVISVNAPQQETLSVSIAQGGGNSVVISGVKAGITDAAFSFLQDSPSNTWTINHNLNKHPSVTVVDSGQNVVYGEVQYTDTNNLTVSFNATFSGNAYLN